MPRFTSKDELNHLIKLISEHQNGIGIRALWQLLGGGLPLRSLQRRLAKLIEQGQVQMTGEARAVRYCVIPKLVNAPIVRKLKLKEHTSDDDYVPTSTEGELIKAYVRQPRQLRLPVGYKLQFLEQYHPNQTAYLSKGLRDQLHT